MRANGETPLPAPVVQESGKDIQLPSRDSNRKIPCRVFEPEKGRSKGIFYHIHGGGWVLQNESAQDTLLKYLADHTELTVVSVGYRLAPEHPYPAGNEDCFDVADYLVDNGEKDFGGKVLVMGGESAGGHLTAVTFFNLLESRPDFRFKALVLNYGCFDISSFLPQAHHFPSGLVLDLEIMQQFQKAYVPNTKERDRRDPKISPLFKDLNALGEKGFLVPALFTCGTLDPLLDDSVLMSTKWMIGSGGDAILKIYPVSLTGKRVASSRDPRDACLSHLLTFCPSFFEGSTSWLHTVSTECRHGDCAAGAK